MKKISKLSLTAGLESAPPALFVFFLELVNSMTKRVPKRRPKVDDVSYGFGMLCGQCFSVFIKYA